MLAPPGLAGAFDVGVVCSHWEGLPLAALETMAAGVPLVASAVGGLPTLLADGAGLDEELATLLPWQIGAEFEPALDAGEVA